MDFFSYSINTSQARKLNLRENFIKTNEILDDINFVDQYKRYFEKKGEIGVII